MEIMRQTERENERGRKNEKGTKSVMRLIERK